MGLIDLSAAPSRQPQYAARPSVGARGALVNVGARADVLNGRPLTRYASADASLVIRPNAYGLAVTNSNVSQAYSVPMATVGLSAMTMVALLGGISQSSVSYAYVCGLFNGSTGVGLSTLHSSISNRWGVFQGATGISVLDSGEAWPTSGLQLVVYSRSAGGARSLYRNGVLKATDSSANPSTPASAFYVGALYDAYLSFGSEVPVYYAGIFIGEAWSAEQIRALAVNPWAIFSPDDDLIRVPSSGGASAELAGSATSIAAGTASLTTQIRLTGAAASVATSSGSLTSAISLSGAAASVSVASGVLTTQIRLSGDALAQVLASGALTTQISLSGAAVMQALASADLTTTPAGLSGSASATATATGQLSTGILLLGEASCIAIAAGGLTTAIQMTGAAVSVSTATGDLTVTSGFSASALAEVTATGTLSTQIQLDAAAVMQAIAAASLTTGAQTVAFYDELDAFYGDFAVQCSANGVPFNGIMDTTDADQFGTLSMSTHRLRYPAVGSAVMVQDEVMVSGVRYKVIEIPRRISRSEMVAELVKQS